MKNVARLTLVTALLAGTLAGCGANNLQISRDSQVNLGSAKAVSGQVLVKFKSNADRAAFHKKHGSRTIKRIAALNLDVVQLKSGTRAITQDANAVYVEPDYLYQISFDPNDVSYGNQYALKNMEAPKAWEITKGSSDVVIAIVDTGVDLDHEDLKDKLVAGYNAVDPSKTPDDDNSHGTHCAGISAASTNNGVGVAGLAINCKVMPVKVMTAQGSGSTSGIADGITWAVDHGADVISLSLGGPGGGAAMKDAVDYALSKNVTVIAAMGNNGTNQMSYPAAYPGVIAVGASDKNDKIASFSQYGNWISVAAPGVDILATTPNHDNYLNKTYPNKITKNYSLMSGTSMATPYTSGLAGLVLSQFPNLTPAQVKERLEKTADKVQGLTAFNDHYGHGRINAVRALTK
ncbi:MAG: S8 family peptidase [Bacteroidota bacterium]